jgi:uncharacterized protein YjiS (DUF1127 family)
MADVSLNGPRLVVVTALRRAATGLVQRARTALVTYREQRMTRDAFMNTVHLDDRLLDDIGVTREEVERAARLPLRVNASHALYARARSRRASESKVAKLPLLCGN